MTGALISTDPCTGAEIWRGPVAGAGDVHDAVGRARAAQRDWEKQHLAARVEVLRACAATVRSGAPQLAACIARETGKPLWEAETEVTSVAAKVEISIRAQ